MKLRIACAVDADERLVPEMAFIEAHHYRLYDVTSDDVSYDKNMDNTVVHEAQGAAPIDRVIEMLRPEGVQVLAACDFGGKKEVLQSAYALVTVPPGDADEAVKRIAQHAPAVETAWNAGAWRQAVDLSQ
jgi:predicted Fe-Mo cluster-binding NifX family protein